MIKRKTRLLLLPICAILFAVCLALSFSLGKRSANAEYAVETAETVRDSYMLGEKFTIPDGTLVQGENRYQAKESMLVFPDGIINGAKEQVLSQTGEYMLLYAAEIEGTVCAAQKTFSVVDSYYSFSGDTAENGRFEFTDEFNMAPESELSGIRVQIPKDSTFHLNEAFDVSLLTKDNPVVTIYPYNNTFLMGKNGKTVQANDIQIILTDYYDPSNYIVLDFHWAAAEYTSPLEYASKLGYWAAAGNSKPCGMSVNAGGKVSYNGSNYSVDKTYYGVGCFNNYNRSDIWKNAEGQTINSIVVDESLPEGATYHRSVGFSFYYDVETMEVYASDSKTKRFVSNVGLSSLYGDQAFKGFSGDKFYLSIRGDDYRTSSGSSARDLVVDMEISNILGREGRELIAENTPSDSTAPLIKVDGVGRALTVAKGETIKIPTPTVKDVNLKSVVSEVYFGYGTSQQSMVAIEDDCFTLNRLGNYTIVYIAEDTFGNVSTAQLDMSCKILPENRSLRIVVDEVVAPEAGTLLTLPRHVLEGENSGKSAKVFYAYGDGECIELDETGAFFIDHVGEYTVRYEFFDCLVSYDYEYSFTSVASDNVTIHAATLPNYFVKGSTYTLERLYAFTYTAADPTWNKPTTYVSEDDGAFVEINADAYRVNASNSVRFKYVLDGEETYSASVPVKDVRNDEGRLVMSKHFVTSDFNCEENNDRLVFTPTKGDVNTMEFVNPISLSNFYLEFLVPEDAAEYDSVQIKLTDYYNHANTITVNYKRAWVTTTSGNDFYGYTISCNGTTYRNYEKHYEGNLIMVKSASGKISVGSGEVFDVEGVISADKVLLTITVSKATVGESRLEIGKLNNVVLGGTAFDDTRPQLYYQKDCALYETLGTEITIYPASATDVLSTFVIDNLTMYVKGPNNASVTALDGSTVLDSGIDVTKSYTFRLEENGRYVVTYKYTDTNGNSLTSSYSIYILDDEAPTLTLDGGYNENTLVTVNVDSTYTVQTYKVSDTVTATENLYVSVIAEDPNGVVTPVKNGKIVFKSKGVWKIYYYCMDETGNTSMTYYTVKVV